MESLLTEIAVVLVLGTRLAAWRSRPSALLLWITLAVGAVAVALPYAGPLAAAFGFVPLPAGLMLAALIIVVAYVAATEATNTGFTGVKQCLRKLRVRRRAKANRPETGAMRAASSERALRLLAGAHRPRDAAAHGRVRRGSSTQALKPRTSQKPNGARYANAGARGIRRGSSRCRSGPRRCASPLPHRTRGRGCHR